MTLFSKIFFGVVLSLMVIIIAFKFVFVYNVKQDGKFIYQIDVNSYNGVETYTTTEFTKDEKTGCIVFKDEFGIKRIVCNNYTITEY